MTWIDDELEQLDDPALAQLVRLLDRIRVGLEHPAAGIGPAELAREWPERFAAAGLVQRLTAEVSRRAGARTQAYLDEFTAEIEAFLRDA